MIDQHNLQHNAVGRSCGFRDEVISLKSTEWVRPSSSVAMRKFLEAKKNGKLAMSVAWLASGTANEKEEATLHYIASDTKLDGKCDERWLEDGSERKFHCDNWLGGDKLNDIYSLPPNRHRANLARLFWQGNTRDRVLHPILANGKTSSIHVCCKAANDCWSQVIPIF